MIASAPADILRFAAKCIAGGVGTVLVTLTAIEGSSPRAIGAQMVVAADGRYLGSFSGGCIEAAVVSEAIAALADGRGRLVRFGAGSPYIDIRLPCGGGIDLLFNPLSDARAIEAILSRHATREVASVRLGIDGVGCAEPVDESCTGWRAADFFVRYEPELRVVALGQGEELLAVARLARSFGAGIASWSPDHSTLAALASEGFDAMRLETRTALPDLRSDPWTALLFLFHDRDWEEFLLPHALRQPAFYIGAIGSRRTQHLRVAALEEVGVPDRLRQRLRHSIGLIPATRDPATLALSVLAQIVEDYQFAGSKLWSPQERDTAPIGARR